MSRFGPQRDGGGFKVESSLGYTRDTKKVFVIMIMPTQYFINSSYLSYSKHIIGFALPYIFEDEISLNKFQVFFFIVLKLLFERRQVNKHLQTKQS